MSLERSTNYKLNQGFITLAQPILIYNWQSEIMTLDIVVWGKEITCAYWNTGPSFLINKHNDIKTILQDHKHHTIGLGKANFKHGQDI